MEPTTVTETHPKPVEVLVCQTCKHGLTFDETAVRPGARLLSALDDMPLPGGITLRGVECLSNCSNGCTIAVRGGADRWTYVYGNLSPEDTDVVLEGVTKYLSSTDGIVPWRERPTHFRKNCIARIPPLGDPA
jgi:predicted metal-binding protein